jgi:hypothetical protein
MDGKLQRLLLGSYAGIVVALVGGLLTMPEVFYSFPHRGISFWGNYFPAVVPYSLGLFVSAICLALATYYMPEYPERMSVLRRLMLAIVIGMAVILLTPEQANIFLYWAHTLGAIYLFAVAGMGSAWIMLHAGKSVIDWTLFWMLITGVVFSLLSASYIRILGVLALGQVLAINAAALIIIRAALRWSAQEVKE